MITQNAVAGPSSMPMSPPAQPFVGQSPSKRNPFAYSPNKSNPFARPVVKHQPSSFKRATLLPSKNAGNSPHALQTPKDKSSEVPGSVRMASAGQSRQGWRLLWRGGLEIGKEGYRLDGITFFAQLSFPPLTPSAQATNPFDAPILPTPPASSSSPFPSLPSVDTDLCLSLESMRGRKYLQVRGLVELSPDEILDGGEDAGQVQVSVAPNAPLLATYLSSLLARESSLSSSGRTLKAIYIGLGDESVDSASSSILVYGQLDTESPSPTMKLLVGRRKPKPAASASKVVKPGEPLPRVPRAFPDDAPNKPIPFPRRTGSARPFARAPSVSSIYQHPQHAQRLSSVPPDKKSPGRRDEKRPRTDEQTASMKEQRDKRSGKVIPIVRKEKEPSKPVLPLSSKSGESTATEEDIFGSKSLPPAKMISKAAPSVGVKLASNDENTAGDGSSARKRAKVSQQTTDNKATIRKQAMLLMAERGCPRDNDAFKDVFGMTTKGIYFAFREKIDTIILEKEVIQDCIVRHLDMYLPDNFSNLAHPDNSSSRLPQVSKEATRDTSIANVENGITAEITTGRHHASNCIGSVT